MKNLGRMTIGLAAAGMLAAAVAARQPGGGQPEHDVYPRIDSINFPGGTLDSYVELLKKSAGGKPVNVVISGSTGVQLPPISLKQVTLSAAMSLVEMIEVPGFKVDVGTISGPDEHTLFVVRTREMREQVSRGAGGMVAADPQQIKVFSVRGLLSPPPGRNVDPALAVDTAAVLTAVETALEFGAGDGGKGELKFHPESQVLVVRGTVQQTSAVGALLGQIEGDLIRARDAAEMDANREANLVQDMRLAEVTLASEQAQASAAEAAFKDLKAMLDAGNVSKGEVMSAELRMLNVRSNVEKARILVERASEALRLRQATRLDSQPMDMDGVRARIKAVEEELMRLRDTLKTMEAAAKR